MSLGYLTSRRRDEMRRGHEAARTLACIVGGRRSVAVAGAALLGGWVYAALPAEAQTVEADDDAIVAPTEEAYPDRLDGTLSAEGDLEEDEAPRIAHFRFPTSLGPWLAFKEAVQGATGINFGGSYGVLWQNYQESLSGEENAVGGKFTMNFSKDLLFRETPNALIFDMAVEARHPIGTNEPPLWAGLQAGSITATAATWGEFDLGITQAYIRQNLDDNRFQYTIGKIFAPNFINAYPFFDDNRQFLSLAFSTSPTIASPLRGFGAVAAAFPTDGGLYVKPGVFTNHSSDTGSTINDFFTKNERFYMLEVGLSGLAGKGVPIQARGPTDANNIHLTGWYRDPTQDTEQLGSAYAPRSYGVAFNVNQTVGDNIMWFLRARLVF